MSRPDGNPSNLEDEIQQCKAQHDGLVHRTASPPSPEYSKVQGVLLSSDFDLDKQSIVVDESYIPNRPNTKSSLRTIRFPDHASKIHRQVKYIRQEARLWYKEHIYHGLLRQRRILPSKDGRHIILDPSRSVPLIDERTGKKYASNSIRSSRYTIWNFFPCQLWFQFSKGANFYFLATGIVQLIPGLSTTGSFTTILPLLIFLCFSIAREGYDDFRRYRLDKLENRQLARVLHGCKPGGVQHRKRHGAVETVQRAWNSLSTQRRNVSVESKAGSVVTSDDPESFISVKVDSSDDSKYWATVPWVELEVGDVIELQRDETVPADIVLLHVEGRNSTAYIETMALDGETNLKSKLPPLLLSENCSNLTDISTCKAHFVVEDPNIDLYDFNGKVTVSGKTLPLTLNNVIYRGSIMRNTPRAIGMIINTGEECKIRMNASKNPKAKAPALQTMTNRVVILLATFWILLSIGCTVGYVIWTHIFENEAWYLADAHLPLIDIFVAFAIEFNNLIPLALYVSLEIVKLAQYLLLQDIEMYDEASNTPMMANTQTIFENLGQINYILSDKTGTLTENVMRFRKMSVAGTSWLHNLDVGPRTPTENAEEKHVSEEKTGRREEPTTDALVKYLQHHPGTVFTQRTQLFLLSLALCHTCYPEIQQDGGITFEAESPDEFALVKAAQDLGLVLIERDSHSVTLLTDPSGSDVPIKETYQVLDVIEFSTKRKRMSIIIRLPNGKICIFCKGADSVIQPRLRLATLASEKVADIQRRYNQQINQAEQQVLKRKSEARESRSSLHISVLDGRRSDVEAQGPIWDKTNVGGIRMEKIYEDRNLQLQLLEETIDQAQHLDESGVLQACLQDIHDFATDGLRTLLYGVRFIDEDEYINWKRTHDEATMSLVDRQEKIEACAEMIEVGLELAGATAIEDKLQKGVPETIEKLRRANIKVWMLTGDKRETAINIAHSAGICHTYSKLIVLDHEMEQLEQHMSSMLTEITSEKVAHSVVVVHGKTFADIEHNEYLATLFYDLLLTVDSVICCRASPSQKAAMVKTIRHKVPDSMTLAIGDGGNDIAMIQEAHVGVGISGKEGLQAARVADYSIAQFRFLQRLLFVHGHWNYMRTAKYVLLTFWKEMVFYSIQILYSRWNGYTGTSLYESDSLTVWNTLFTSLCVILPGVFEQDLSPTTLLAVPELYSYGQQSKGFNLKKYALYMVLAAGQSILIYFMVYELYGIIPLIRDQGLFALGDLPFSVCVVFINFNLLVLQFHYKTWIPIFGAFITIFGWWAWNLFLAQVYYNNSGPYAVYQGFLHKFGRDATWWAVFWAILAVLVVFDLVRDALKRGFWLSDIEIWQELEQNSVIKSRLQEMIGPGGYDVASRCDTQELLDRHTHR